MFITKIAPLIQKECEKRGYKYPSAIIAQACLESRYGDSVLSKKYHNYFGLKCGTSWKGKSVKLSTMEEYKAGELTKIQDNFRVFDSMEEGVKGYFEFIKYKRYSNLKDATSATDYLTKLKNDGYCTSSKYVKSCTNMIDLHNLRQYDPDYTETELLSTVDTVARDVIKGLYGNGEARKKNVENAGYDYEAVQKRVNEIIGGH